MFPTKAKNYDNLLPYITPTKCDSKWLQNVISEQKATFMASFMSWMFNMTQRLFFFFFVKRSQNVYFGKILFIPCEVKKDRKSEYWLFWKEQFKGISPSLVDFFIWKERNKKCFLRAKIFFKFVEKFKDSLKMCCKINFLYSRKPCRKAALH